MGTSVRDPDVPVRYIDRLYENCATGLRSC